MRGVLIVSPSLPAGRVCRCVKHVALQQSCFCAFSPKALLTFPPGGGRAPGHACGDHEHEIMPHHAPRMTLPIFHNGSRIQKSRARARTFVTIGTEKRIGCQCIHSTHDLVIKQPESSTCAGGKGKTGALYNQWRVSATAFGSSNATQKFWENSQWFIVN